MEAHRLVVAADDRTGALETAGAIADSGLPAVMVPWATGHLATGRIAVPSGPRADVLVVDLASRHADPRVAATRAATVLSVPSERSAHKIDSTLRGNWAVELGALVAAGRRVLLIPAFPAAGRACVGGTVLEHGVAITERHAASDIRTPVRSSRPADHLRAAGVAADALANASAVERWLARTSRPSVGVCDASTDDDLQALSEAWVGANPDVVLAGTAAAIGAGAAALAGPGPATPAPALPGPALVVAGSAYPIVRAQTDSLIRLGATVHVVGDLANVRPLAGSPIVVLRAPLAPAHVSHDEAFAMARLLADHTHAWLSAYEFGTLLIVGGDTAAAVLGDAAMAVGGTLAPGMPWCRMLVEGVADGPLVVTKPGGFGGADALVALLGPMMPGFAPTNAP